MTINQLATIGMPPAPAGQIPVEVLLKEAERRRHTRRFMYLHADEKLYPKHRQFMAAGKQYRQRIFLAGNRVGKTVAGLCEVVMHLTGMYPDWWEGKRFESANSWWVVGKSSELVKQTLQPMLLGNIGNFGTGLVPDDLLDHDTLTDARKANTPITTFRVKHVTGGWSQVEFKTAAAGRAMFQGTERSVLIDEECPEDVYQECLLRTMTGDNILVMTFTPLMGLTSLLNNFFGGDLSKLDGPVGLGKHSTNCGWDQAPHLTEQDREELYASLPPHQREARTKGIPSLGAGVIYPVPESTYVIQPFDIPKHWKRVYGLDVGWKRTAGVWLAINPDDGVIYVYSEHYVGESEPSVHATAIRSRGEWIPGVIDSAANGRSQVDGEKLMQMYTDLGLKLTNANKSVETGLYTVWELLSQGRIKVFSTLTNFMAEIRVYRRDEKGHIVKSNDHLMDAFRYAIMTGRDLAITEMQSKPNPIMLDGTVSPQYRRGW